MGFLVLSFDPSHRQRDMISIRFDSYAVSRIANRCNRRRAPSDKGIQHNWTCPGLMDTPKSAKVRAIGVDDDEGAEA